MRDATILRRRAAAVLSLPFRTPQPRPRCHPV